MAGLIDPTFGALLGLIAAVFAAVHIYGALVCDRVMIAIEGTPYEGHVRELMPGVREDMVVVTFIQGWWPGRRQRQSLFGYHPWNATVWLGLHVVRYTLPNDLPESVRLLRKLRWAELGLMAAFAVVFALNLWSLSVQSG